MTDIIKDAKQLLDGATPGPWEVDIDGLEVYSTVDGDAVAHAQTPSDADLIAAAPELAQALAEETWEYTQEIYFDGKWQPIYEDLWYDNPEECESLFLDIEPWKWNNEPVRIVRRRVSPMEVINE